MEESERILYNAIGRKILQSYRRDCASPMIIPLWDAHAGGAVVETQEYG